MAKSDATVHVVFGISAAATMRLALRRLHVAGQVVALPDMLSVGPIDPPDHAVRHAWATSVLRLEEPWRAEPGGGWIDPEPSWAAAMAPDGAPVFWACLDSPPEHACYLAFASRMQDRPFDLVDAAGLEVSTEGGLRRPSTLGMLRAEDVVSSKLYARRRRVPAAERAAAAEAWARLRRENAPFRIVRDGRLVSAPLTHYDDLLVGQARPDWEIAARLIGRIFETWETSPTGDGTSDDVLFGRMLALGATGALQLTGPGPDLRNVQVRRPA